MTVGGKSVWREGSISLSGGEPPPRDPSGGSPKGYVLCLLGGVCTHSGEGAEGVRRDSSNDNEFLTGIGRQRTNGLLAPMFENQRDRFAETLETFLTRFALAVSPGYFRAIRDVPRAIPFDNRSELVAHTSILVVRNRSLAIKQ